MEQKVSKIYSDFDSNRKRIELKEEDEIEQQAITEILRSYLSKCQDIYYIIGFMA